MMNRSKYISIITLLGCTYATAAESTKPNIVLIVADDIGYGDLGCYGADLIKTPNIDALAAEGVRFENAYSPASTSTPTRYALLTGEYAWRNKIGIMAGDDPLSIDTERNTLPKMLSNVGYDCAIVGKWHLGIGTKDAPADFNRKVKKGGMKSVGFDYSYIFPATNDRVPTIFMENDKTVGLDRRDPIRVSYTEKVGSDPTGKENPNLLRLPHFQGHDGTIVNGVGRMGWMDGGYAARWRDEEMTDILLDKAIRYIKRSANKPFMLYYATHTAHEPRVASPKFQGVSNAGPYGDVIEEFDYCVGEVVKSLKEQGIFDNTLIIITSDNGPMIKEGYIDGALENIAGHDPFAGLRGTKYTLFEGGSRVPFVASWGDKILEPFVQSQRFCYIDILATLAEITSTPISQEALLDSRSARELFFEKNAPTYRPYILTQNNPGYYTLRIDDWKYIPKVGKWPHQLYNLKDDPSERRNVVSAPKNRVIVDRFMEHIKALE